MTQDLRQAVRAGRLLSCVPALLILLFAGAAGASPVLVDGSRRVDLAFDGVLNDPGSRTTVADIRVDPTLFAGSNPWSGRVSLGFTADAVWLRSEIVVLPAAAGRYVLVLDIPNFERLEVWGSWVEAPVAVMGDDHVTEPLRAWRHTATFDLPAGRHTLWFRAITSGPIAVPLALWQPDALAVAEQPRIYAHTILTAVAALLGLGALLLAAVMPSLPMLLYAGSALASTAHIMAMNGLDKLMWGGHLPIGTNNPFVWLVGSGLFGIAFLFSMLPLRRHPRWVVPVAGVPVLLGLILLVTYNVFLPEGDYTFNLFGPRNLALLILATGVVASVQSRLMGHRPAGYMIFGWLALVAGNVVAALRNAGALPFTGFAYFLPVYAPIVEMLFFAAMLAAQLRLLRIEKDEAQRALVVALRRNEEELAERVAARTADVDRANALLSAREAQLRQILEAAPMPIVVFQTARSIPLYTNRRMRELLVGGENEAMPDIRTIYQVPEDGDRLAAALDRDGFVENAEVAMRDGAGNQFWALASMVAIDYRGQPASLLAINDISRRRQLEQELVKAKEMAEAAAGLERAARDAQRQFLAMVSHEFRTPLAVISTATQFLQLEAEADPAREPRLARIRRAVSHMNGMIDACLLDDRIEGAGLLLRTSLLDPVFLVCKAVDAAKAAAPQHVFTTVTETLPKTAGDGQLLGMALSNLMENAVKYSPPGSAIEVTLKRSGDDAVVTVADRGQGVPADECGRVFEKYYRCSNVEGVPGAGLGLYLTRHIVTAHGGTVGIRNRPEGGAVFTIRLPLQSMIEADDRAVPLLESGLDGPAWNGAA
ncbi:PAS domain S-box-containing protein [Azospirillum agricola]|uniref:sensor histidine kinase n=1 Tax=Azospirillum agricola TaxID=1720247 RepID=UPI001AEB789D|nr:ATP-binding protein [Azospirillum agricola]MBP2232625.1 PAS domain S-box-containing protein [Azospirillum agricola]